MSVLITVLTHMFFPLSCFHVTRLILRGGDVWSCRYMPSSGLDHQSEDVGTVCRLIVVQVRRTVS
jgi:hypothetical protein